MGCGLSCLRPLYHGDDENVEYFTGRANNCMTFNSKLYRSDRTVLCSVKLMKFAEKGTLHFENKEYRLEHRFYSGDWEIVDNNDRVHFSARKISSESSSLFMEEHYGGTVINNSLMKLNSKEEQDRYIYRVPTDITDLKLIDQQEQKDELVAITRGKSQKEWKIKTFKGKNTSEKYLAFAFMMYLALCKRQIRDNEEEERRKQFKISHNMVH